MLEVQPVIKLFFTKSLIPINVSPEKQKKEISRLAPNRILEKATSAKTESAAYPCNVKFEKFILEWYANIPEETSFWVKSFGHGYFKFTIFLALIVNFVFPLIFLIKRGNKRNFKIIGFGSALLIFGHYVDFFNYTFVEPNWNKVAVEEAREAKEASLNKTETVVLYAEATEKKEEAKAVTDATPAVENKEAVTTEVKKTEGGEKEEAKEGEKKEGEEEAPVLNYASINIGEVLVFIGFLGAFLFLFFRNLAKRPITPENDPYLKECERIVVTYS